MTRLGSARWLSGVALLVAVGCARTGLDGEWVDGELGIDGGTGGTATATQHGAGGDGAVSAVGGALNGGTGALGGTIGVGANGGAGGSSAGTGGSARGGMSGRAGSGAAGRPPSDLCGNGKVDPGEDCDAGDGPFAHPAIELRSNGILIDLVPVVGAGSAINFYDYFDKSSHTGNENVAGSKIYFYRSTYDSSVSIIIHSGIDFDTTGFVQPDGIVNFEITGLPASVDVLVSDDDGEVVKDSPTSVAAAWVFGQNTDGCVLGTLPFPGTWDVTVTPSFVEGIDSFTALSGDGYRTGLALARPVELIASDQAGGCRRDCTLPFCGDGQLDAGEICDDGNAIDLDGCTACQPDVAPRLPDDR